MYDHGTFTHKYGFLLLNEYHIICLIGIVYLYFSKEEPWFPCKDSFTLIQQVSNENRVEGDRGYKERNECEVCPTPSFSNC